MGYADLHCHWIAGIDDGCRTPEAGVALLKGLKAIGFSTVVATPHMRPGMFENDRAALERAYARMQPILAAEVGLPEVFLASEHWFDDTVYARLRAGEGLPYPAKPGARLRGVLVEMNPQGFPPQLPRTFVELRRKGLFPVIAHPERYQPVWKDDGCREGQDFARCVQETHATWLMDSSTSRPMSPPGKGARCCRCTHPGL